MTKLGRVVWHDLFTSDVFRSKAFLGALSDWHFVTETASDFAWGGGDGNYTLALSGGEAGAGLVEWKPAMPKGWLPYVEVSDVDATAQQSLELGGGVERHPFDVPGVGRNAIIRDTAGALIGIATSSHNYPIPNKQFGPDVFLSANEAFPISFYSRLFGWYITATKSSATEHEIVSADGNPIGSTSQHGAISQWVPTLRISDLSSHRLSDLGASRIISSDVLLWRDPMGTLFSLSGD